MLWCIFQFIFFFFKQKTAYEMRISDWSSDVCSSDLAKLSENGKVSIVIMGRDIGRGRCRWLKSLKPVTRGTVRPVIIVERAHDNVEAFKITQNLEFVGDILSVLASPRSEEHTSELQSLMRISYAGFCLKKKKNETTTHQ